MKYILNLLLVFTLLSFSSAFATEQRGIAVKGEFVIAQTESSNSAIDKSLQGLDAEEEFWLMVKDSNNADDFRLFLKEYPHGRFASLAKFKIAKLEKGNKCCSLTVRSNVSGDMVFIDGKSQRSTSKKPFKLSPGTYNIVVKKKGYDDWSKKISLSRNNAKEHIYAKLQKKYVPPVYMPPPRDDAAPAPSKRVIPKVSNLLFSDTFDNNRNNWPLGTKQDLTANISNGGIVLEHTDSNGSNSAVLPIYIDSSRDFSIEADITHLSGSTTNPYGISWGGEGWKSYEFVINASGSHRVQKYSDKYTYAYPWTANSVIKEGNYVTNTLKIDKKGNDVYLYVNGTRVKTVPFESFFGNEIGFSLHRVQTIKYDNLRIRYE